MFEALEIEEAVVLEMNLAFLMWLWDAKVIDTTSSNSLKAEHMILQDAVIACARCPQVLRHACRK